MKEESVKDFIKRKNIEWTKQRDKELKFKDISRKFHNHFIREKWTFMPQSNNDKKTFVIERLRWIKNRKSVH